MLGLLRARMRVRVVLSEGRSHTRKMFVLRGRGAILNERVLDWNRKVQYSSYTIWKTGRKKGFIKLLGELSTELDKLFTVTCGK